MHELAGLIILYFYDPKRFRAPKTQVSTSNFWKTGLTHWDLKAGLVHLLVVGAAVGFARWRLRPLAAVLLPLLLALLLVLRVLAALGVVVAELAAAPPNVAIHVCGAFRYVLRARVSRRGFGALAVAPSTKLETN